MESEDPPSVPPGPDGGAEGPELSSKFKPLGRRTPIDNVVCLSAMISHQSRYGAQAINKGNFELSVPGLVLVLVLLALVCYRQTQLEFVMEAADFDLSNLPSWFRQRRVRHHL